MNMPLYMYQPNDVDFYPTVEKLNSNIFEDIFRLRNTSYPNFESVYKHMSFRESEFEILCFKRFFAMLEHAKENNIDRFCYCDSDAVFIEKLDFSSILGEEMCVACKPGDQPKFEDVVCAHFSIWSVDGIQDFCDFMLEVYSNKIDLLLPKWEWHKKRYRAGGICDMTLLYHWYKSQKNMLDLGDKAFDHMVSLPHGSKRNQFVIENGLKVIEKIDNKLMAKTRDGGYLQMCGIHCQGINKNYVYKLEEILTS